MASRCSYRLFISFLSKSTALPSRNSWSVPHQSVGESWPPTYNYWLDEFRGVVATMQDTHWNGTCWPATVQWIGAVLNTFVSASALSLTDALGDCDEPGSQTTPENIRDDIESYLAHVKAYYNAEDVNEMFDDAYDDVQWVVLEWLQALNFINRYRSYAESDLHEEDIANFAHRTHIFYNIVQDKFDTSLCGGGMPWNSELVPYKNAITNELFVSSSVGMYLYFPGDSNPDPYPSPGYGRETNSTLPPLPPLQPHDPLLLDNAIEAYEWFKAHNFTNTQGLIVDGFHISDNQTACDQRDETVWTYNQGVILSGLRQLWEATAEVVYLQDGYNLVDSVVNATGWHATNNRSPGQWSGLGRNGILEDFCDATANCSQDNQIFKGIYFHHLNHFCDPLPTEASLVSGVSHVASNTLAEEHEKICESYTPWIVHNARAALSTRNDSGVIGGWWGSSSGSAVRDANSPRSAQKPLLTVEKSASKKPNQDVNDQGRGRTVETQGSGLGVVKAASEFIRSPSTIQRFGKAGGGSACDTERVTMKVLELRTQTFEPQKDQGKASGRLHVG